MSIMDRVNAHNRAEANGTSADAELLAIQLERLSGHELTLTDRCNAKSRSEASGTTAEAEMLNFLMEQKNVGTAASTGSARTREIKFNTGRWYEFIPVILFILFVLLSRIW